MPYWRWRETMSYFGDYTKDAIVDAMIEYQKTNPDKTAQEITADLVEAFGYGLDSVLYTIQNKMTGGGE